MYNFQTLETAFHHCAKAGNNDVLCEMIAHMSQTEVQKALNRQTDKGWTPLLIACHRGHMELVCTKKTFYHLMFKLAIFEQNITNKCPASTS